MTSSLPVLDLLRERRRALGHDSILPYLPGRRPLLRRGVLIGGGVLALIAAASALVFLRQLVIQLQMARLERYEAEATGLRTQLASRKAGLNQLVATNRGLADALTTVRTTSALLTDLQLRTPSGIQLTEASASGPSLVLKGRSTDPLAFARINALQLELDRSPLFKGGAVNIKKVQREPAKSGSIAPDAPPPGPEPVAFEISGPFDKLAASRQLEVLRGLGADGMARRLELLQKEGLLP